MPFGLRQAVAQIANHEEREALLACATMMMVTARRLGRSSKMGGFVADRADDIFTLIGQHPAPAAPARTKAEGLREMSAYIDDWQRAIAGVIRAGAYAIDARAAEIGVTCPEPARWRQWANRLSAASRRRPQSLQVLRRQTRPILELAPRLDSDEAVGS